MIEIQEVKTRKQLKEFASFPVKLYKDCPYYVPSLRSDEMQTFNPKKNFSLAYSKVKGFLCYKDGELVGRIAGIISEVDTRETDKKFIRFSRFEAINDIEVFKALLGAVEKYGKENGLDTIHGPWGFNDQDREGMLVEGYNERSTYATNYYFPYYAKNMRKLGFTDESKWIEFRFVIPEKVDDRMVALAERIKKKYKLTNIFEKMSVARAAKKYGESLVEAINDSYGELDGYVNIEGKMIKNLMSQFATILNPRYASMLVDENGKVVAFAFCLPSIANALIKHKGKLFPIGFIDLLKSIHKTNDLEMALIGVRSEYKNSGLNAVMITEILQHIIDDGIVNLESNPMLEHNLNIIQQWKFTEHNIVKRRQTFVRPIK